MSFGPTGKCTFCGGVYYLQKLAEHELICSMRPKRLTLAKAVRTVIDQHPEASTDMAQLVRLVWQVVDGYLTEPPRARLTDPRLVMRALSRRSKVQRHPQFRFSGRPRTEPRKKSQSRGERYNGTVASTT